MNFSKYCVVGLTLSVMLVHSVYASEPVASAAVTPAEISALAAVAAIDKNEILIGDIALHKKITRRVAALAKMMVDQHGANLTEIFEMANQLHALPLKSDLANQLTEEGDHEMLMLGGLQGEQFDKAYVDAMVSGHEAALKLIDQQLMKTVQSSKIKKFMVDTRAAVEMHLMAAKKLQKKK